MFSGGYFIFRGESWVPIMISGGYLLFYRGIIGTHYCFGGGTDDPLSELIATHYYIFLGNPLFVLEE